MNESGQKNSRALAPNRQIFSGTITSSSITIGLMRDVAAVSLSTLPQETRPQLFIDFQDAAASQELDYLSDTINGWLTSASLYGQAETQAALQRCDDFAAAYSRLLDLFSDDGDEEYVRPTRYAFNRTLSLLIALQSLWPEKFPRTSVSADFNGGIRLQWVRPDRQLRVITPSQPDGHHYLYREEGEDYEAIDDPDPAMIAEMLDWFFQD